MTTVISEIRSLLPWRVPARWRPFARLALLGGVVVAGDRLTGQLVDAGWSMDLWLVSVVRVVASLPTLRYPLAGFIFALEVDKWDWFWLDAGDRSEEFQSFYQQWDKALDLVTLGVAAYVALGWRDDRARKIGAVAFVWRAIGTMAYVTTGASWLMVAFPNVFETWFLLYVVFHILTGRDRMLEGPRTAAVAFFAILIPKVAVEVFLHLLDTRPWDIVVLPIPRALDDFVWGAVAYALPMLALAYLVMRAGQRRRHVDPERRLRAL